MLGSACKQSSPNSHGLKDEYTKGRNFSKRFTSRRHDRDWILIYPIPKAFFRVRTPRGVDEVLLSEIDRVRYLMRYELDEMHV